MTSASDNSISACQSVAFIIYNQNFGFEQQIVNSPCFSLSTTTNSATISNTETNTTTTTDISTSINTASSTDTTQSQPTTTAATTTACPIDFSPFNTEISNISSTFDSAVASSLSEEIQLSDLDYTFQNLFAENGVGSDCQSILDEIVPVSTSHNTFLACISSIQIRKQILMTSIQTQLTTAIDNCDSNVCLIILL